MTQAQKEKIIDILLEIHKKVDKLPSIEAKKKKYYDTLRFYVENELIDFDIDFESDELDELITNNFLNIEIAKPQVFVGDGYHPWLENESKSIIWSYKNRYLKYLLKKKHWNPGSVFSLDQMSDIILDHTANPKNEKYFHVRGLVMGDIQSGKTANYTALVNKAIDTGYKIIIILAGLTRELRNQTQKRLDYEVAGRITSGPKAGTNVGVGEFLPAPSFKVETLTYADDEKDFGDFKKFFTQHVLDENLTPVIAVVKKNTSVLSHLHDFLTKSAEDCYENGKLKVPVMIIDDEVDQASVDTKAGTTISEASAINKWIRTIISKLNRSAYVGYTATPFANVFIDPDKENDLYPKDFILYMPPSKGYCGIKEYFGVDIEDEDDENIDHSNDLFREIKQSEYLSLYGSGTNRVSVDTDSTKLSLSLKQAIRDYVIACSIKKSRGIGGPNSMLIHIARFKNPSNTLKPLVIDFIADLLLEITYNYKNEVKKYKERWESDFMPVSVKRLGNQFNDSWESIAEHLSQTLESIKLDRIKVLNGDSGDVLNYGEEGDYIIIGGDKLSRGLTLEGLSVSYYWRKSQNYDSLLQMARWFGYRNGWIDVCRIYTSSRFMRDFITVGKVLERFKLDLASMYNDNLNPRDVGQRIMYSSNLLPTSRNKMKNATKLKVSFSNEIQQIISFDRDFIPDNYKMTIDFINNTLGKPTYKTDTGKLVYKKVSVHDVLGFLSMYKEVGTYYEYGQINVGSWIKYIENLVSKGELTDWTIVVSSITVPDETKKIPILNGTEFIYKRARRLRDVGDPTLMDHYTVKAITEPSDFREALERGSVEYSKSSYYDKEKTYEGFTYKNGLLSIYVFDLHERIATGEINEKTHKEKTIKKPTPIEDGMNVVGPAIWFPKTKDYESSAVAYYVTKDYLTKPEETSEDDDNDD